IGDDLEDCIEEALKRFRDKIIYERRDRRDPRPDFVVFFKHFVIEIEAKNWGPGTEQRPGTAYRAVIEKAWNPEAIRLLVTVGFAAHHGRERHQSYNNDAVELLLGIIPDLEGRYFDGLSVLSLYRKATGKNDEEIVQAIVHELTKFFDKLEAEKA